MEKIYIQPDLYIELIPTFQRDGFIITDSVKLLINHFHQPFFGN